MPRSALAASLCVLVALAFEHAALGQEGEHVHGGAEPAEPSRTSRSPEAVRGLRSTHGLKTASAVRFDGGEGASGIRVDGQLNEPIWTEAPVASAFVQREPQEGKPATERTEFRVLYDRQTLYIGVICYDSEPENILASERQRDRPLENDDYVTIALDTFHDHRNFSLFRTNPLGTQYDALITDEGRDINRGWDEKWEVVAVIVPKGGWTAEFAIPFKTLRVSSTESQVWGLEVERVIRRKNEFSYWNGFKRGFKLENISQAGHLRGLEDFDPGFRFRIKPFLVAGFKRSSNSFSQATKNASDAGLEVLKYRVTPGLMADFTVNSNFVETPLDIQQVNLDRWELFYNERREFFQEAGVFKFGVAQGEMPAPDVALFHTRRIGYYSKREGVASRRFTVPLTAATRVTGKVAGFTVGLLDAQTDALAAEQVPESNYGVIRVKRDVLGRSAIGGFLLNREIAGSSDYNRVYGFDTNFVFKEHFFANALYARSLAPGVKRDNWTSSGSAKWDSDFVFAGLEYLVLDPNFRDDLGFTPRPNIRRISPLFDIKPRPARLSKLVRRLQFGVRIDYVTDQEYTLQTRYEHYNAQIFFQSGDQILIAPHRRFERVNEPFELRSGISVPAGDYQMMNLRIAYTINPARRFSGALVFQPEWGLWGGDIYTVQLRPRIKVSSSLTLEPGYTLHKATLPQGRFDDHLINSSVNYSFSNRLLTTTTIQYNNTDSAFGFQFRLDYLFRPGDRFNFIYTLMRATGDARFGQMDQTVAAKLNYSFDF